MSYDYVLDSSAWIEYFSGTKKGEEVQRLIEDKRIATSILAIAEVADKLLRSKITIEEKIAFIHTSAVVLPVTMGISVLAAQFKNSIREHNQKFSLIDGIHLATAQQHHAIFLTTDNDFKGIENVRLI